MLVSGREPGREPLLLGSMEGIASVRRRQGRRQTPRTILNRTVWVVRVGCRPAECAWERAERSEAR
ncbi:hypothetical protein LCGC14_1159670 [marine sediment metagenome]|uniref:Uncharacterized protein n=1 Tax=marine sediment metagenome TaxID=412755 RepID=A0A0F9LT22_9ZZZZ